MILYNSTGLGLREDPAGSGRFGAPRGDRTHEGIDRLCVPGQIVRAEISGKLVMAYPYHGNFEYTGCRIWGKGFMSKMFYFTPYSHRIGESVLAGEEIGIAQNISLKYGNGMRPHIHVAVYSLNPTKLLNPEDHLDTEENRLRAGGY